MTIYATTVFLRHIRRPPLTRLRLSCATYDDADALTSLRAMARQLRENPDMHEMRFLSFGIQKRVTRTSIFFRLERAEREGAVDLIETVHKNAPSGRQRTCGAAPNPSYEPKWTLLLPWPRTLRLENATSQEGCYFGIPKSVRKALADTIRGRAELSGALRVVYVDGLDREKYRDHDVLNVRIVEVIKKIEI